jgi:hypothetical protein
MRYIFTAARSVRVRVVRNDFGIGKHVVALEFRRLVVCVGAVSHGRP